MLYPCGQVVQNILCNLKYNLHDIPIWFQLNSLKPNSGKFPFMILGKKDKQ